MATCWAPFSLNQHQAANESTLTIVCERARSESRCIAVAGCRAAEPDADWTVEGEFELERDDMFVTQANRFMDFLDGKAEPGCTLAEVGFRRW
ncbi:MAG: hypothetical protein R3C02_04790 [Planctomycetaceae bacterium]